jgi:hypothetical protein
VSAEPLLHDGDELMGGRLEVLAVASDTPDPLPKLG